MDLCDGVLRDRRCSCFWPWHRRGRGRSGARVATVGGLGSRHLDGRGGVDQVRGLSDDDGMTIRTHQGRNYLPHLGPDGGTIWLPVVSPSNPTLRVLLLGPQRRRPPHRRPAADHLEGERGDDALRGGAGDDLLYGRTEHDTLTGGPGDDLLEGGRGRDRVRCGAGNDTAVVDASDRVTGCEHLRRTGSRRRG